MTRDGKLVSSAMRSSTGTPSSVQVTRAEAVVGRFGPTIALTVALAVFSWRVRSPSPWWDEAVTRYAVGLSLPDLADMISRVDLVHALYYLAGHILYLLLGDPTTRIRYIWPCACSRFSPARSPR